MGVNGDLLLAADDGNCGKLLASLAAGANVDTEDGQGRTPLILASQNGHYEICQILLQCGANVNECSKDGVTPLHEASLKGYENVVRLLVDKGACLDVRGKLVETPLHLASKTDHVEVVTCLLSHGADINALDFDGNSPLHYAAWTGYKDMVQCLLRNGAKVGVLNYFDQTPAMYALYNQRYEIATIIEKSQLYEAAFNGQYERCEELLESDFTPIIVNIFESSIGLNPVTAALQGGHSQIVNLFLQRQFDVNYDNIIKELPAIFLATDRGHYDVVSFLLECGVDPDTAVNGDSILHLATQKRNTNLVNLLLLKGANPNITDGRGFTALHYAVTNGDERIVADLLEHNANVNAATSNRETALHMAFTVIDYKIGQVLVRKGADIDAKNDRNETPLDVLNRKWADYQRITDLMIKPKGYASVEEVYIKFKNTDIIDLVVDKQDSASDVSDSDATVAYACFADLTDFSEEQQEAVPIMQSSAIEELQSKMDDLMGLVLEVNDMALGLNQLRMDLLKETEAVENLHRRMDNNRRLRELKTKNSHDKTKYEETLKALTEKQEQAKRKESELKDEIETNQTNFRELKAKMKLFLREIGEVL